MIEDPVILTQDMAVISLVTRVFGDWDYFFYLARFIGKKVMSLLVGSSMTPF